MRMSRLNRKYVQLFCISCLRKINVKLLDHMKYISCHYCNENMEICYSIDEGIKTIHLKLYEGFV